MLRSGDICLVIGDEEIAGSSVELIVPVAAKSEHVYEGILIRNHTKVTFWVIRTVNGGEEWTIPEPHLMPLRGDENPTTELSGVQRSDTVVA